jgi:hypothetical protein
VRGTKKTARGGICLLSEKCSHTARSLPLGEPLCSPEIGRLVSLITYVITCRQSLGRVFVPVLKERSAVVKVLVGKKKGDRFRGFLAAFEGEEVSSYEDTREDKKIVCTLYKCTAYNFDAYRVHVADESDPANPEYELHPYSEYSDIQGLGPDYSETYRKEQLAAEFPLFLKYVDYFGERHIDPG